MAEHSVSYTARESYKEGKNRFGGRIESTPYTKKKGELPIDDFGVTLSAHKAL